jgi:hypothetical protein
MGPNVVIYTAATALLGICLCRDDGPDAPDISGDWVRAIGYLKIISPKCAYADQCAKVLEAMMTQMSIIIQDDFNLSDPSYESEVPVSELPIEQPLTPYGEQYDTSSVLANHSTTPTWSSPDWTTQDIVWSNIPWDWGLVDEFVMGYE